MSSTSLFYWNDQFAKTQPRVLRLQYAISAAKTAAPIVSNSASLITFDAFASQTVMDNFLGTTSEFLLAAFDATAMGNDTFGGLVNLNGQGAKVVLMRAHCASGTGGATVVDRVVTASTALTASTLATEVALGTSGNVGFRVDFGNTPDFDALTSGVIEIEIHWISK